MSRIVAMAALITLAGCATKKDIRLMREDMQLMSARQDSVLRGIQRQNAQLLDSIRATMSLTVATRGNTSSQLSSFEQMIRQVNAQLENINTGITRLDRRMTALEEKPPVVINQAPATGSGGGTAEEYYLLGQKSLADQGYSSARAAFQQLLSDFPLDPRAADAQFGIGETYAGDAMYAEAYRAYEVVVTRWATSAVAPRALFRAGQVAQDHKEYPKARAYYERVRKEYASSDEARAAQRQLQGLPRS